MTPRTLTLSPPRWVYFLLFTASGFAGLIYESIWSHYLKLFLGHAAYAQSLVLMIFMGGLALGSWLVARFGTRWRLPILIYAVVEAVVGLFALVFHETFVVLTGAFYTTILPGVASPGLGNLLKWSAAALLMLPQTVLLGMTFPLLSAGILRRYPDHPGGSLAMLYFTNSIGAAVGVLAGGFVFVGMFGLPGTIRLAGVLNLVLAAVVSGLVALDPNRTPAPIAATFESAAARRAGSLFLLAAFVTGLASFIYEIAWIRMLSLVLGSTTHSFELMLSAFITGLAFGGLFVKRYIDTVASPLRFAGWVLVLMGVVAVLSIPVYSASFGWMANLLTALQTNDPGYTVFTLVSHGIALAVMLPTTFLAGMTLPLFTHVMMRSGAGEGAIGRVYAANTVGAIAGVLFAVHIGLPWLGVKNLVGVGALLDVALGVALLLVVRDRTAAGRQGLREPALGTALGAGAIVLVLLGSSLGPAQLASGVYRYARAQLQTAEIPFYQDGKTASIAVARYPGGRQIIVTNGKPEAAIELDPAKPAATDEGTMILAGALPLAYKADARRVANIGLGSGLTTHTLLADPRLEVVDTIEIEPAMVTGARLFGDRVARAFNDPRSRIHIEDAKTFFPQHRQVYDIIVAEPSNPWVSGVASLFSTEFYALIGNYLADDGILVQWLQFYEFSDELFFSVLKALEPHFEDFVIYNNIDSDGIIIARRRGRLGAPDYARLIRGGLGAELSRVDIRSAADLGLRRSLGREQVRALAGQYAAPANSDYYPYVDLHAPAARYRRGAAEFVRAWSTAPLPMLEMLAGGEAGSGPVTVSGDFSRTAGILAASALTGIILRGEGVAPGVTLRDSLLGAAGTVALAAAACPAGPFESLWLPALHEVAAESLPHLPPARAVGLMDAAVPPACRDGLSPPAHRWVTLYRAVAARDGRAMAAAAGALLAGGEVPEGARRDYVYGSLLLGHLAVGDPAAALNAWTRYQGSARYQGRPLPPFLDQLLKLAAGSRQERP